MERFPPKTTTSSKPGCKRILYIRMFFAVAARYG